MPSTAPASLHRTLAAVRPAVAAQLATRNQLMEASEWRLSHAASSGIPEEELIADRLFDNVRLYARWQTEHETMLCRALGRSRGHVHEATLIASALSLIHRKAFFEYLLAAKLRGKERIKFVKGFFGHDDYKRTLIVEHGNYLRSAASFLCFRHIGTHVLRNPLFEAPLLEYEELYGDYFFASSEAMSDQADNPLLGYSRMLARSLKRQTELRRTIILRSALGTMNPSSEDSRWH